MSTLKKAQLVMLPTNEKARLILGKNKKKEILAMRIMTELGEDWKWKYQHLYFLSDEEIKEEDWVYDYESKQIIKIDYLDAYTKINPWKKIIATTDSSLHLVIEDGIISFTELPQPSQSFLEVFVREYNKENVIKEVLVKYEQDYESCRACNGLKSSCNDCDGKGIVYFDELKLKINSKNNSITIKRVKESWDREEVIELITKAYYAISDRAKAVTLNEWIEQNL